MPGRMIRVGGKEGPMYAVAESRADVAMEIIRTEVATNGEFVEDMGRVTDELLSGLHLGHQEFKRV